MPLAPGTQLGPYEVVAAIGAGGMGEVYRGRDTRLQRDVAIKLLPPSFAADKDRLRRFKLEAQSASALNHPNILTVYDVGSDEQSPYLITELLEGESLSSRLRRGKLGIKRAVDYGIQIAAGLAAAHAKGITHRDIKPDNLYLTKDGRVKILDFGLAKVTRPKPDDATATRGTNAGGILGTAAYMSPEQARGQVVDPRSDIFSLGCVLDEMLTGERTFEGDTTADLLSAILAKEPDLSKIGSPDLERIVVHCLEKNPEQRFQSASDVAFALESVAPKGVGPPPASTAPQPKIAWLPWTVAAISILACGVLAWLYLRPARETQFLRLTFRRGTIQAARFTSDGNSVIYSARWEDEPSEIFSARLDSPGSRPLGFPSTELRALSPSGELALAQKTRIGRNTFAYAGMLARAPLAGGAPRSIEDRIDFADWSPNRQDVAVVRETDQGTQLEFPAGKVLYRTAGYISEPRISPAGDRIAFLDHPLTNDNRGSVAVIDLAGNKQTLTTEYLAAQGLAWAPKGDEVWFTAARTGNRSDLRAVDMARHERVVFRESSALVLHDIAPDGRVLLANLEIRTQAMFHAPSEPREREVSWLDWSLVTAISQDGKFILINESGEGAGADSQVYLRETSGAPAVLLGPEGNTARLSPDDRWVVCVTPDRHAIQMYPVGPGQSKRIPVPGYVLGVANLFPDSRRLWFSGNEPGHGARIYITDVDGAKPRVLTPEGQTQGSLSPEGAYFLSTPDAGTARLYSTSGGEPLNASIRAGERIGGWSQDGQDVFVFDRNGLPARVYRVNWKTGHRELLQEINPADRAGVDGVDVIHLTPDGKTFAYSYVKTLSDLYMVKGLK